MEIAIFMVEKSSWEICGEKTEKIIETGELVVKTHRGKIAEENYGGFWREYRPTTWKINRKIMVKNRRRKITEKNKSEKKRFGGNLDGKQPANCQLSFVFTFGTENYYLHRKFVLFFVENSAEKEKNHQESTWEQNEEKQVCKSIWERKQTSDVPAVFRLFTIYASIYTLN